MSINLRLGKPGCNHIYAHIEKNEVVLHNVKKKKKKSSKKMKKASCTTMCKVCYLLCQVLAYTQNTFRKIHNKLITVINWWLGCKNRKDLTFSMEILIFLILCLIHVLPRPKRIIHILRLGFQNLRGNIKLTIFIYPQLTA